MEEGIDDETCMMAHEMLEQVITPEEAEALLEVFPTQRSKRWDDVRLEVTRGKLLELLPPLALALLIMYKVAGVLYDR